MRGTLAATPGAWQPRRKVSGQAPSRVYSPQRTRLLGRKRPLGHRAQSAATRGRFDETPSGQHYTERITMHIWGQPAGENTCGQVSAEVRAQCCHGHLGLETWRYGELSLEQSTLPPTTRTLAWNRSPTRMWHPEPRWCWRRTSIAGVGRTRRYPTSYLVLATLVVDVTG